MEKSRVIEFLTQAPEESRVLGTARGDFAVPADFDEPLPDEILAEFEK